MWSLKNIVLGGTTDGSGALTVNAETHIYGQLFAVEWVVGSFAAGVDAVLSVQETASGVAQTLLTLTDANANAQYYPRLVVHGETGIALTGTSGGDRTMPLIAGRLRLAVTSGGAAQSGRAIVHYFAR